MVVPTADNDFVSDFRRLTYDLHLHFTHVKLRDGQRQVEIPIMLQTWLSLCWDLLLYRT